MRSARLLAAALLLGPLAWVGSAAASGWIRPVEGPVQRPFALGADRFAAGQHRGVDLAASAGTTVRAACGGRVTFAGHVPRGGRTVTVRCGPVLTTYQHLGGVAVQRGRRVMPGTPIGTVGRARPRPHVHLGARDAATGAYLNPLDLLGQGDERRVPPVPAWRPAPGRPAPLGPAPRGPMPRDGPAVASRPGAVPAARPALLGPVPAARLPLTVWAGVVLVALGLPLGGGVVALRLRRRRDCARATTSLRQRWPSM